MTTRRGGTSRAGDAPARDAPPRPTAGQLAAAAGRTIPDLVAPGLRVLFCGINPGLYTAAVGHHFARPGNRFWPVLHAAGFTPRRLAPDEERLLLDLGYGLTCIVSRATAAASELAPHEYVDGGRALVARTRRLRPRFLAILGIGAYRAAFARPHATFGPQPETIGSTRLWVLPNPSGLNAHYRVEELARLFRALREAVDGDLPPR